MRKIVLSILLLVCAVSLSFGQYDSKALKILEDMSATYKAIPAFAADLKYSLENGDEGISENYTGSIVISGEKYVLKLSGQEIFNNGETVWTFMDEVNEVNIDNIYEEDGEMNLATIYDAYKEGYKYKYIKEEVKGDKTFDVIDLIPEDGGSEFTKLTLMINRNGRILERFEMLDLSETKYIYQISKFNKGITVTDSSFEFDASAHAGVEIIDLR